MKSSLAREALAAGLVLAILVPALTQARPVGLSVGDEMVYQGKVVEITSDGGTKIYTNEFSVLVMEIDNATINGLVTYNLTITRANGTTLPEPITHINHTVIFDPLYNNSYLGSAFYPFVYTDLHNGSVTKLPVQVPINLTGSRPLLVNASVVRTTTSIFVGVSIPTSRNSSQPIRWAMQYDASTGVLKNSSVLITLFGLTRNFHYTLLSFHPAPPQSQFDLMYAYFVVAGAAVVFIIVSLVRRPSRQERGTKRMKEKFGKKD